MMSIMDKVKALTFDVFGTVVDWRGTIVREGTELSRTKGIDVDWGKFADTWRAGYAPAMNRVRKGELPWTPLDKLHRMILDTLLDEFRIRNLNEAEKDHLNRVWHRLSPWPDSTGGMTRLRRRYVLATLSNGNVSLLVNMARHAALPWDCILSAELAKQYKPAPAVYLMAAGLLDLPMHEVLMVAAHKDDLRAAQQAGLRTAFVPRPLEFGPGRKADPGPHTGFDLVATDFYDLAHQLEA
jgi:2-haloacid dehalogenase